MDMFEKQFDGVVKVKEICFDLLSEEIKHLTNNKVTQNPRCNLIITTTGCCQYLWRSMRRKPANLA